MRVDCEEESRVEAGRLKRDNDHGDDDDHVYNDAEKEEGIYLGT